MARSVEREGVKVSEGDREYKSGIESAKETISGFRRLLPDSIGQRDLSDRSRLPLKVQSARELTAYRAVDLAEAACVLFEKGKAIAGILASRAALESVAWLISLSRRVRGADQDPETLHILEQRVHRLLFGTRAPTTRVESLNILTVVDEAMREYPRFRDLYDYFSESSHPAALGTLLSYARLGDDGRQVFDATKQIEVGRKYPELLGLTIQMAQHAYALMGESLHDFAALCDAQEAGDT